MKLSSHNLLGIGPSLFARFITPKEAPKEDKANDKDDVRPDTAVDLAVDSKNSMRLQTNNPQEEDLLACPSGSCGSTNKDKLYDDSEDYEAAKLVKLDIHIDVAKEKAHEIILHRRKVDEKYEKRDRLGLEGQGPIFSLTSDGDVYFPEFNDRLGNMYVKQKDKRLEEYHKEEHETVCSAYQSLRDGATQAAHIVHYYNEKGELEIRDVVVLTYNRETNIGQMHILNISENGKNHASLESAHVAMEKRLVGFEQDTNPESNIILFVRKEEAVDPISLFRERQTMLPASEQNEIMLHEKKKDKTCIRSSFNEVEEVTPIIRTVVNADNIKDDIPFMLPRFLQRLMDRDENGHVIQPKKQDELQNDRRDNENTSLYEKPIQNEKVKLSREKYDIEKQKEKMEEGKKAIVFAEKTGVGIGGAIAVLESMNQPVIHLTKKEKRMLRKRGLETGRPGDKEMKRRKDKEIKRLGDREMKRRREREARMLGDQETKRLGDTSLLLERKLVSPVSMLESRLVAKSKRKETKMRREKEMKRRRERETRRLGDKETKRKKESQSQKKTFKEKLGVIFSLKEKKHKTPKKERNDGELTNNISKEKIFMFLVVKLTRALQKESLRKKKKQEKNIYKTKKEKGLHGHFEKKSISTAKKEQKQQSRILTMEFVRAWILFALLKQSLPTKKINGVHENISTKKIQRKEEEEIQDSTPWVLLSIIWHMSAIREQGKAIYIPKKKKKHTSSSRKTGLRQARKKKRKLLQTGYSRWISRQGIIYAYPS